MATSATSDTPNARHPHPPLSYAERARRAALSSSSSSSNQTAIVKALPSAPNGVRYATRSGDESTSPTNSSRNLTPSSTAALTLPCSPPLFSPQTSAEDPQMASSTSKSPAKAMQTNVWAARKEQLAQSAGQQQQGYASVAELASQPLQPRPSHRSAPTSRVASEGSRTSHFAEDLAPNASSKVMDDPFVVRMPSNGRSRRLATSTSASPPSLDDADSWPEMARTVTASSSSVGMGSASSATELDRKEESTGTGTPRKSEKPKWVPIPRSELQATHDALVAHAQATSRAQSQQRRGSLAKSCSRQQSQARTSPNQNSSQFASGAASGTSRSTHITDSGRQTRATSSTHSRATSVHSSPHIHARGRRLPDDSVSQNNNTFTATGPSNSAANSKAMPASTPNQSSPHLQARSDEGITHSHAVPPGPPLGLPRSGPHSQTHTPFQSQSPVFYPPPHMNPGLPQYGYSIMPPSGIFIPSGGPSPSMGVQGLPQGYPGYPPYGQPQQFPPAQQPFPYFFPSVPYQFYSPQAAYQSLQQQPMDNQTSGPPSNPIGNDAPTPPFVPPPSSVTRPPPPSESAALSGYRDITTIPVSPLLSSTLQDAQNQDVVPPPDTGDVIFGSIESGGLKSPSPEPVLSEQSLSQPEGREKRRSTSFAVGYDGASAVRLKITTPSKDSAEGLTEAVKVIDLTDKESKWEFGTSTTPGAEMPPEEYETSALGLEAIPSDEASSIQAESGPQVVSPQPQHMMQFPPPPHQMGGYPLGLQMHMMSVQQSSPQGPMQPLPHHVPSLGPLPLNPGFVSPLALGSPGPTQVIPNPNNMGNGDEWEVRDFGYGFGAMSGSGYMPERLREERFERETRESMREQQHPREPSGNYGGGRGRHNANVSAYGNYFDGPRGYGRRGRGMNGFGRGFGRGGFNGRGGNNGGLPRHHQSLSVTTGSLQQQQTMQQPQISPDVPNGYYAPPPSTTTQYIPSPYPYIPPPQSQPQMQTPPMVQMQIPLPPPPQQSQHPIPAPLTVLSFPLDPTRRYLLGQVEYYFSLQNLAQDYYLRKQMDSRGWLPIHLIANFNRVQNLTQDQQLVRDVLEISSLVELRGDFVRLSDGQWESFVLPGATPSQVEGENENGGVSHSQPANNGGNGEEEDEDDDVVFVMGGQGGPQPWKGTA